MNPKVLVGVIVVLVVLLAAPLLMNALRGGSVDPPPPPAPAEAPPPPPLPPLAPEAIAEVDLPDFPVTYQAPQRAPAQYERQQGPAAQEPLTAESLVGTAWEVSTPYGPAVIELGPNGQATATHSMVGAVPGNWSVRGDRVKASASFMGQSMSVDATIDGNSLKVQGQNIRRVR